MGITVRELLSSRGIEVSDANHEELTKQWTALKHLKEDFEEKHPGETDIALKYISGGGHL